MQASGRQQVADYFPAQIGEAGGAELIPHPSGLKAATRPSLGG